MQAIIPHFGSETRTTAVDALRVLCLTVILLMSGAGVNDARAVSSGPPDAHTGAPAFGGGAESDCTACHSSFAVNSGLGLLSITSPTTYEVGMTYEIRVLLSHTGRTRWGFELTALDDSLIGAGELLPGPDGFSQVSLMGTREYVKQTTLGTADGQPDQQEWIFSWTAPQTNIGPVTFYAAGVAANSTGGSSGDDVYTAVVEVPEPPMLSLQLAGCCVVAGIAAVRRRRVNRRADRSRNAPGRISSRLAR